jgi:hypothetical protein
MKFLNQLTIIIIGILIFNGPSFAAPELLPIMSAEQKSAWINELTARYPWIGNNAPGYVDLEQNFLRNILNQPDFIERWAKRPDLENFRFGFVEIKKASGLVLRNEIRNEIFNNSANETLNELRTDYFKQISKYPYSALLTGIVATLRNTDRGPIFKETDLNQQLVLVKAALELVSREDILKNFRADRFGFKPEEVTASHLLQVLESSANATIALSKNLLYQVGNAELFKAKNPKSIFSLIEQKSKEVGYNIAANESDFMRIFSNWFIELDNVDIPTLVNEIEVEEVPPQVGIYRGIIGGDCSTNASWAYSYSPYERTFLVKDGGVYVGYITGSYVTAENRPAFALKDMHGPRLRNDSIDQIVLGFYHLREHLGVDNILIPDNHVGQSHNAEHRTKIQSWGVKRHGAVKVTVTFDPWDQTFRDQTIRRVVNGNYDVTAAHAQNWLLRPTPAEEASVGVEITKGSKKTKAFEPAELREEITRKELFNYLETVFVNNQSAQLNEFTNEVRESFANLSHTLENPNGLTLEKYYDEVAKALAPFHLTISNKLFEDHPGVFAKGHLSAPNAFQHFDEVSQFRILSILDTLLLRTNQSEKAAELLRDHLDYFEKIPDFKTFLLRPIRSPTPNNLRGLSIIINAIHTSPFEKILHEDSNFIHLYLASPDNHIFMLGATEAIRLHHAELITQNNIHLDRVATLLNNESKELDENLSLIAIKILIELGPNILPTATYWNELYHSVRDDENNEIRARAALLVLRRVNSDQPLHHISPENLRKYGQTSMKKMAKRIEENAIPADLMPELTREMHIYYEKFGPIENDKNEQAECADILQNHKK